MAKAKDNGVTKLQGFIDAISDVLKEARAEGCPIFMKSRRSGEGFPVISILNDKSGKWHFVNLERGGGLSLGNEQGDFKSSGAQNKGQGAGRGNYQRTSRSGGADVNALANALLAALGGSR